MGLWLGGFSRHQKIVVHSKHYISLAEYDQKTDQVSVRVRSWDKSGDIFESLAGDSNSPLAKVFLSVVSFIFAAASLVSLILPLILGIFNILKWETVEILVNLGPAILVIGQLISLVFYCYFGRFAVWHAAEHKAIIAYEYFKSTELEKIRLVSRVSDYCGTNRVASFILDSVVLSLVGAIFHITPLVIWPVWLIRCAVNNMRILPANWFGRLLQKHFTTKEPSEAELRTAQAALAALIAAEEKDRPRDPLN